MNKDVVFKNNNVTVFKDGRWRCEKCHRAARERGIKPPGLMNPGENCRFIDEYGNKCNNHYSNDPSLARMKQSAERRRREEEANAPPPPKDRIDSANNAQVVCHIFGEMLRCFSGAAFGRGGTRDRKTRGRKLRGRKTRGRKTRGRKTRGRKTRGRKSRGRKTRGRKRKNTKNTRYQKRAR